MLSTFNWTKMPPTVTKCVAPNHIPPSPTDWHDEYLMVTYRVEESVTRDQPPLLASLSNICYEKLKLRQVDYLIQHNPSSVPTLHESIRKIFLFWEWQRQFRFRMSLDAEEITIHVATMFRRSHPDENPSHSKDTHCWHSRQVWQGAHFITWEGEAKKLCRG